MISICDMGSSYNDCNGDIILVWRWRAEGPVSALQSQPTKTQEMIDLSHLQVVAFPWHVPLNGRAFQGNIYFGSIPTLIFPHAPLC